MITVKNLNEIANKTFDLLKKNKNIKNSVKPNDKTILLGDNAILDSISFVTFLTTFEELLEKKNKKSFIIQINKIHDLNQGKEKLVLGDFKKALLKLLQKSK